MTLVSTGVLAQEGSTGVVLPAPAELFWGAVGFAIFYWVMQRFVFPRINEVLEQRAANIQGRIAESEERLSEAEQIKARYERQLADARGEANRIIDEARQTAESMRRDIVARAESEAETIVQRARSEVTAERERAVEQLRSEVGRLSVQLAGKIVDRELDADAHQSLIDRYIDSLAVTDGQRGPGPNGTPPGGRGGVSRTRRRIRGDDRTGD